MRFVVGCDLEEFKKYYKSLEDLHNYFKSIGLEDVSFGELGEIEEHLIKDNPSHLIVWRLDGEVVGHAIWHESSTGEHRRGVPRDREVLERLVGGEGEFVELHEVWLKSEYRGRGFGERFFEFFEELVRSRGDGAIVFYTDNPAAMAICRKREYKEEYYKEEAWYIFYLKPNIE